MCLPLALYCYITRITVFYLDFLGPFTQILLIAIFTVSSSGPHLEPCLPHLCEVLKDSCVSREAHTCACGFGSEISRNGMLLYLCSYARTFSFKLQCLTYGFSFPYWDIWVAFWRLRPRSSTQLCISNYYVWMWMLNSEGSWQGKKDSYGILCWIPWTTRKTNKWILEQLKPELSLEAKMMKLRLSYFEHIMRRQDSLQQTIIDLSLQKLSRVVEDRTNWRSLIHEVTISQSWLDGTQGWYRTQFFRFTYRFKPISTPISGEIDKLGLVYEE